jgi:TRAP-type C4-dicarboxylate transport system substrate-binding protein
MKTTRWLTVLFTCLLSAAVLFPAAVQQKAAAADNPVTWKIQSHWPTSSSSYEDSLKKVADELREKTDGKLILEPYPADALVPSKEIFAAVKRGMLQGGTLSPGYVRDYIKIAGVASGLPFAFKNTWECAYFHQWYGFEDMLREAAAEHGVYWTTDKVYPTELVLTKPVRSLEDFKGLKLRSSGVLQTFLSGLGAAASYLPGSEVYPALSSGVVDGAHWGAAQGAYSMNLYEVCKYHLLPPLNIASTDVWVFNQKAIDNLPENIQEIFYNTMDKHFWERTNQYQYLENVTRAKAVSEKGVEVIRLPAEEQQKITAEAAKIWDKEAEKSPEAKEAVKLLKEYLKKLGHL